MEFDGIAEGCQLGDCLIRPNPKRSMKNWRNNDGPSCAQKSAGMGGIGWGGVQMRFPRRFSAASHWVGQSGVWVGRLHLRIPGVRPSDYRRPRSPVPKIIESDVIHIFDFLAISNGDAPVERLQFDLCPS